MQRRLTKLIGTAMAPKKGGKKEANSNAGKKEIPTQGAINLLKSEDIGLKILAKPGSSMNQITGITEEGIEIKIAAPPVDGEANTELISFLSKLLGLRKSDLSLDRGNKSRTKSITISKDCKLSIETIKEKINSNIGK